MSIFSFLRHQLGVGASAPDQLAPLAHFKAPHCESVFLSDMTKGKGVTGFDVGCWTGNDLVTHVEFGWGKDIPLFHHRHRRAGQSGQIDSDRIQWRRLWLESLAYHA